jgi:hypothetical protein
MYKNVRLRGKLSPKALVSPEPKHVCLEVLKATSKSCAPVEGTEMRWPVDKNPQLRKRGSLRTS